MPAPIPRVDLGGEPGVRVGLTGADGNDAKVNSEGGAHVTPYHEDGTEGALISGVNYVEGKSGIDASTETLITTDYSHHEIHDGNHYVVHINKDVANGGTYNIAFTTPDTTTQCHMEFMVTTEGEADVILYEGITSFGSGSAFTPINSNRNSTNTSVLTDMEVDTTAVVGSPTTLGHAVIGSGRSFGGTVRGENEFDLKRNTKYLLLITNQITGSPNETNISLVWYEHTPKN